MFVLLVVENAAVVDRGETPNDEEEEAENRVLANETGTDRSETTGTFKRDGTNAKDEDVTNDATTDKEDADVDAEDDANQTTNKSLGKVGTEYRRRFH